MYRCSNGHTPFAPTNFRRLSAYLRQNSSLRSLWCTLRCPNNGLCLVIMREPPVRTIYIRTGRIRSSYYYKLLYSSPALSAKGERDLTIIRYIVVETKSRQKATSKLGESKYTNKSTASLLEGRLPCNEPLLCS